MAAHRDAADLVTAMALYLLPYKSRLSSRQEEVLAETVRHSSWYCDLYDAPYSVADVRKRMYPELMESRATLMLEAGHEQLGNTWGQAFLEAVRLFAAQLSSATQARDADAVRRTSDLLTALQWSYDSRSHERDATPEPHGPSRRLPPQLHIAHRDAARLHTHLGDNAGRAGPEATSGGTPPHMNRQFRSAMAELNALVGLEVVKRQVGDLVALWNLNRQRQARGMPPIEVTHHLVLAGNPGTGKTTVARILAKFYRALGILPGANLHEVARQDLVAAYLGQTAIKTARAIDAAMGGVLFIDEAYSLASRPDDYGSEAIATLVSKMENHRDELVVIVAGYPGPMRRFLSANPGLRSRFQDTITFPDYSNDELVEIFSRIAVAQGFDVEEGALSAVHETVARTVRNESFGNGRLARSLFESACKSLARRTLGTDPDDAMLRRILPGDIPVHPPGVDEY